MRTVIAVVLVLLTSAAPSHAQVKPDRDYLVYVLSESADKILVVRFGANGAHIERQIDTGDMPIDIDGPHGIVVSPDRHFYYVSISHGRPFGSVWKYSTKDDSLVAKPRLGFFPQHSTSRQTAPSSSSSTSICMATWSRHQSPSF